MRRETGFFGSIFNAITHTGTTITRTTGFFGGRKTIVRNYDTGITKEYSHDKGFFGNRTDVKVYRRGKLVATGDVKKDFWGRGVMKLNYKQGAVKKSVKKMDRGLFGNHDETTYYGSSGRKVGHAHGRQGLIFNGYTQKRNGWVSPY